MWGFNGGGKSQSQGSELYRRVWNFFCYETEAFIRIEASDVRTIGRVRALRAVAKALWRVGDLEPAGIKNPYFPQEISIVQAEGF